MCRPTRSTSRPTSRAWSQRIEVGDNQHGHAGPGPVRARRLDLPQQPWPRPRPRSSSSARSSRRCRRATPRAGPRSRRPQSDVAVLREGASAAGRSARRARVSAEAAARCRAPRSRQRRAASWRRCEQQQAGIAAQLGGDPAAPIERHPRYLAAVAARDQAARDLDHTVVRASIDGADGAGSVAAARRVSGRGAGGLRPGRHRSCLGRGQPEGDAT